MSAAQKRKKTYYMNHQTKKSRQAFSLEAGVRGFLVTCNKMEREATSETYALLNHFADELYGPEKVHKISHSIYSNTCKFSMFMYFLISKF